MACTPLSLFKNKNTRKTCSAGKVGMHLGGDQNPSKDSINLNETQKEKNKIKQSINPKPP
jgi:hypothetical protein